MAGGKAISVELNPRQRAILERQLESGRYQTASEVVGDALRLMADRTRSSMHAARGSAGFDGRQAAAIPIDTVFSAPRSPTCTHHEGLTWRMRSSFGAVPSGD